MKKFNRVCLITCMVLVIMVVLVSCCNNGIVDGFKLKAGGTLPNIYVAYKINKAELNIESFEIEVYFGWLEGTDFSGREVNFSLIIYNVDYRNQKLSIELPSFSDDEYVCKIVNKSFCKKMIEYSHSETILLPSNLFVSDKGEIVITVDGTIGSDVQMAGWNSFSYKMIDASNVRLSKGSTKSN